MASGKRQTSQATGRANIAVCGRFHYHHYVRYLHQQGALNRFYHASKISVGAEALGIARSESVNLFPKEYLVHAHSRVLGSCFRSPAYGLYHDLWQLGVLMRWKPAPILHHLLHGTSRKLIARARKDGAVILGEPVNSHPRELRGLLNDEHQRLGIQTRSGDDRLDRRLADDAAHCDYLLVGSEVIRQSFARAGFPVERIRLLPYGTDTSRFSPLSAVERQRSSSGLREVAHRAICVGQITPRKGHVYLLEAWKRLGLSAAELLLVGRVDPIMKPVLSRYAGLFRHIPHVPHELLRHYYGRSDVFVLASIEDGFGYVCAEALACGLPVVTTVNTGASELITDGLDGFVVPVRSAAALAERLGLLFGDREFLRKASEAAVQKAERRLGWQAYSQSLQDVYRTLVV